jgi:nucleoside 2-deoxyribosyltransferase
MATVYWANSIFGEADRSFNSRCVELLRRHGHLVTNPQDNTFNLGSADPTAAEIFSGDTDQIRACDVLVACIDQESIDAGVACEIGIAWALDKRLVGLYTDFRQRRTGRFAMYKNPYVIGCIEDRGVVVSTLKELLDELASPK